MMLLTKEIRNNFPKLYETDGQKPEEKKVFAKFFTPDSNWTWYAFEFDGEDTFFGLVDGFEKELGYFSLRELQDVRGPMGMLIERDRNFKGTLADIQHK